MYFPRHVAKFYQLKTVSFYSYLFFKYSFIFIFLREFLLKNRRKITCKVFHSVDFAYNEVRYNPLTFVFPENCQQESKA
jgi:hypothetical protein